MEDAKIIDLFWARKRKLPAERREPFCALFRGTFS